MKTENYKLKNYVKDLEKKISKMGSQDNKDEEE